MQPDEQVILKDLGINQEDNSCLSCQLEITNDSDGDHFTIALN
jgi:ferredoxin